jgi:hypothetical protein
VLFFKNQRKNRDLASRQILVDPSFCTSVMTNYMVYHCVKTWGNTYNEHGVIQLPSYSQQKQKCSYLKLAPTTSKHVIRGVPESYHSFSTNLPCYYCWYTAEIRVLLNKCRLVFVYVMCDCTGVWRLAVRD